jgi:hypothetical protein
MKHIERLEGKVDKLDERLDSIDKTLAAQHVSLDIHIKRSDALEALVQPIQKHVSMVEGALKLVGVVATIAGLIVAGLEIVKFFK